MNRYQIFNSLKKTLFFSFALMIVFALCAVVTPASAQDQVEYLLPAGTTICRTADTTSCQATDAAYMVTIVDYNESWVAVYYTGQLAGYVQKTQIPNLFDTSPDSGTGPTEPPTFSGNTTFTERFNEFWSLGILGVLIITAAGIWGIVIPLQEANIELGNQKDNTIHAYRKQMFKRNRIYWIYVGGITLVSILIYLVVSGIALPLFVKIATNNPKNFSWLPGGAIWLLALVYLVAGFFILRSIYHESGEKHQIKDESPIPMPFASRDMALEWVEDKMESEGFTLIGELDQAVYHDKPSNSWIVLVRELEGVARREGSRVTGSLILTWFVAQFTMPYCSIVSMDWADLILAATIVWQLRESWLELLHSAWFMWKTILGFVIMTGLVLLLRHGGEIAPKEDILYVFRNIPRSLAGLAFPFIRWLGQPPGGVVEGTFDLILVAILAILALAQPFAVWLFG